MWIDDSEKYALVGMEIKLEGPPPPQRIAPNLWALTEATFDIPDDWRVWLGSIRTDEVAESNLFLVSKLASETPDILDAENQNLEKRAWHFYLGLLLSAMFSPSHKPVLLTGARRNGVIDIRQQQDLELPIPQVFDPYPPIVASDIESAAEVGQRLDAMQPETVLGGLWRFFRTLHIYIETRAIRDLLDRIHQYCRCIDGLILPTIGKTKQQFKSRTELFIGPTHHDLMGGLYDIRSHTEHLHENRYLETFDRGVRLDLVKKEAIAEYIVRMALARIVRQEALWPYFGNSAGLEKFWSLAPDERQGIWRYPIDPMAAVANFKPEYIHDGELGAA